MGSFDPRILRIGVEIGGQMNVYDGLWVTASGKKFANPLQNECEIRIANLRKESRDYLLTETSPFNDTQQRKRVFVDAGRESFGTFRVFEGDITACSPSQPPDITLTLKAKTGQFSKGNVIAQAHAPSTALSEIARAVAASLSLPLVFEAKDKNIANYSFTGGALRQVDKLAQAGGVSAYVDDDTLIVRDYNVPLNQVTHTLNSKSGLIGIPEPTEQGVRVKFFLDPATKLGGELVLESEINPSVNGSYVIYELAFDLSTRDVPFYYIAECKRKGAK